MTTSLSEQALPVPEPELTSEAIEFTNQSRFGNACSIYTEWGAAARSFREHIQAGMVGVNVGVPATTSAPSGYESGL